jgi:hypothetical protein
VVGLEAFESDAMRGRDVRAILFCVTTTVALVLISYAALQSFLATLALTAAYDVWLLTRPRMVRVFRRLRGEPDWSGYFKND